jgi:hypothetical protein
MTLAAFRSRFGPSFALGLGVALLLAVATLLSRWLIEAPGSRPRTPLLRPAAVFAPSLVPAVAAGAAVERPPRLDQTSVGHPSAHTPQPIPEELLLALGGVPAPEPTPPVGPPVAEAAAPGVSGEIKPVKPSQPPKPEPKIELLNEDLWQRW